ncbi:MAG: glycosyltransferase family 2 protein [Candidatus Moranbacteria bacterium]|nr:glycosyltransferase family 2 protein [Candidatus Moranbacteria bacterium]
MTSDPKVSLIFVNYQSAFYLKKALKSLFYLETNKTVFEVIIVNNDPSEKEMMLCLAEEFPCLIVTNDENNGFGAGNNKGASLAKGHILGFINPDTLWQKQCLEDVIRFFEKDKTVGILGMTMYTEKNEEEAFSFGIAPTLFSLLRNNMFGSIKEKNVIDFVSGGALFIPKDIFDQVKGFDEDFFLYFEDVDLCQRVRKLNMSITRKKDFPILHLGGKSQNKKAQQKKEFYISQQKYFQKHRPTWESKTLRFLHFLLLLKNI